MAQTLWLGGPDGFVDAFSTGMNSGGGGGYGFSGMGQFFKVHIIIDIDTAEGNDLLQPGIVRDIDGQRVGQLQRKIW